MARTREFWLYQRRNVQEPWAIQAIVEFDRRKKMPYSYRWNVIIYADWIPYSHQDSSIFNRTFDSGEEFASVVHEVLAKYGHELDDEDVNYLVKSWLDILISC